MVRRLERYDGFDLARTSKVIEAVPELICSWILQRVQGASDVVMTFGICQEL